ncbi:hypothetical protein HDE_03692 [Halotydeus destructor]|nr:hypothetical protein HDE_03692 [Halotydeus destructor]
MPSPYDTNCYHYDKYECIYECSQKRESWPTCSQACSKPGCRATSFVTLAHTASRSNIASSFVIQQDNTVTSTVFQVKMTLEYIVLNVLGLLGVFFGFSVLSVANTVRRSFAAKRKIVKTTLLLTCFTCATLQCLLVLGHHMEYLILTETYQGLAQVSVPRTIFSVCFNMSISEVPWYQTEKPRLSAKLNATAIPKKDSIEFWLIEDDALEEYERNMVTYSVDGRFCYLLDKPVKTTSVPLAPMELLHRNLDLILKFRDILSSCEMTAYAHTHSIKQSDVRIKTHFTTTLQNTYVQTLALPHPYSTACQEYGRGHLKDFKSRADCINACALSYFKAVHPGQHPMNIPIFNNSDTSYLTGDAQEYIHSCETAVCRWTGCDEERFKLLSLRQIPFS